LVRDKAGNLYGTTYTDGAFGYGTVYKVDKTGKETVLYSFTGTGGDGAGPYEAGLIFDAAGNLYGTTTSGGTASAGTVFKVDPTGKETVLLSFNGTDGATPQGGTLLRDNAGNLYGTASYGGAYGNGTLFKLDPTGKETVLYSFGTGYFDGTVPSGRVVRDKAGNLYGTTYFGGGYGEGTVFKVNKKGKETLLHGFTGGFRKRNGGSNPFSGLIQDEAGNLYGTTYSDGTVFKLTPP
jgi:uncharacterized repeat protein (TIGR03803 family)